MLSESESCLQVLVSVLVRIILLKSPPVFPFCLDPLPFIAFLLRVKILGANLQPRSSYNYTGTHVMQPRYGVVILTGV